MPEPHRSAPDGYLECYRESGQPNILGRAREFPALRQDGSAVPIERSASRVDPSGEARPLYTGITRVTSHRLAAERALRESERRLRQVLERVELLGVMLDPQGRVAFCNDYLLTLTGWTREAVVGERWLERFVPEDQRAGLTAIFQDARRTGRIEPHFESDVLTRTGDRRQIAWNSTILVDADGRPEIVTALGVDVTDQRRLESELHAHRARLEELVVERTS